MTVKKDLLYPAFRLAGILATPGRSKSSGGSDESDAFECLNMMVDEWALERLMVYQVDRNVQNVVAGQKEYLIGPNSPHWNVPARPVRIEMAALIQKGNTQDTELPMSVLNVQDYAGIAVKDLTGSTPLKLYYQPVYDAHALGRCFLYPVPQVNNQIALYLWNVLGPFQSVDDSFGVPPGYLKALRYNLAVEMSLRPWHANQVQMNPMVIDIARDTKQWIKSMNSTTMDLEMRCEGAALGTDSRGRWDITSNRYLTP